MAEIKFEDIHLFNQKTFKSLNLLCKSNQKVQKFCVNKLCFFDSLCCSKDSCSLCTNNHQTCSFRFISQLTKSIENMSNFKNKLTKSLIDTQDSLIKAFRDSREQFFREIQKFNCEEKYQKQIRLLQSKQNWEGLTGKVMDQLYTSLSLKQIQIKSQQAMRKYQKVGLQLFQNMIIQRQLFLDQIFFKNNNRPNSKQICQQPQKMCLIGSKILQNDKQGKQKTQFLMKSLGYPSKLKFLFRASEHNFRSAKFHQFCDSISDTVTIIKTQYNRTIVGYTPLKWTSSGGSYKLKADKRLKSFLLQLQLKQKMTLKQQQAQLAISNHIDMGPSFGYSDLRIFDKCNQERLNYSEISSSYNYKYGFSQQGWTAMCGAKKGCKFNIVEYEVFQVIR